MAMDPTVAARRGRGSSYLLLVAEASTDARAFYERHGLVVERRVDGNDHCTAEMSLDLDSPPPVTGGLLMRFTKHA
jgi:hypothetical protein